MVRKGSEVSAIKRYPLRSAHSSGRVLRSASTKNDKACSEPLNDSAAAQPAVKKRKSGSPSGSPNNSVRVLRSALKDKDDACNKPLNDSTADEPAANKRKGASPSKVGSSNNSAKVLRSASKDKDQACSKPLNDSTAGEPAANKRKGTSPSKVGSPNNSARVLRSALKTKNEACSEPVNDSTVAQPAAKKRKSGSPSKVGSPVSSARVLRSTPKRKNEACNEPPNDSAASQPAVRKSKSGTPSKMGNPKTSVRVLRSASKKKNDACSEPVNDSTSAQPAARKRKSGRASKEQRSPKKEYLKISQRVRYILNRMNYEQSLIQAYASEGWKGQSLEKIKPEKELERAKEEILRCKLRIREAFQNMDSLLSEGKLEESLFDSAGEISSEDIFCAICGSKDVTLQNDIVLCDGACDRGFHQNCLKPPLLTKDIPPGDEGWFCPACVCKIDCIDALNELQGSKLSIHDSWEKVFPEAASLANGSKHVDASDMPLDDSEDNHYNPAFAERHMVNEDRSSAEDEGKVDDLGLPSEDSEDDDFDPAGPDSSEDQKNKSDSEESDFTSDSDDFCVEIVKSCGQDEASVSPLSKVINHTDRMIAVANHSNGENSNHSFMEMELKQDMVLPVSSRRQVERLDYKKLYDEAYGKESSDSSDDDEWSGKEQLEGSESDSLGEPFYPAKRCSKRAPAGQQNNEHTPQRDQIHGSVSEQQTEVLCSNGSNRTARKYRFGPIISEKLKVHFEKDQYPSRATKESLAQELGLTFNQVGRWFSSTRHYSRVASAKKEKHPGNHTSENNDSTTVDSIQVRELNAGVVEKLTADRNDMVSENPMLRNNLNKCNKEDILVSGTEIEMEPYGKESSDSSDEEWSVLSTPRKERLEYNETDSLPESLRAAKRCSRRAPAGQQSSEHTPQSERLHGSASERQTEVLLSNGSSSTTRKHHFGPIISQKLKVLFDKDPYPSRATKEILAQELGLTFIQVSKWFSATRHCSRFGAAKNKKHLGKHTTENNDSKTSDSIQVRESNVGLMEKLTADTNDTISEKLMFQFNLNEEDIPDSQYTWCEQKVIMTPTTISREVGPPGYGPGENQGNDGSRNTSCEQGVVMTPTTISREVCPPGYGPGENQGDGGSRNTSCEQRVVMTPTIISREVGPPGYGPGENPGNSTSWNTVCEQRVLMSPMTISRDVGPPGYGPGKNQSNDVSCNTSCGEQGMFTGPSTISKEVGAPGYEPGENQGNGAPWNTTLQGMFAPTTISREVGPPGYGPVENQGIGGSRNINCEQRVVMAPTTISREVYPPGYGPGENKGNGASRNVGSPKGRPVEKVELSDEARKKAILRELRRRQKFR
ncbi:homeobox protein HAZ1-like [Phragmites australis]|uniref:homeobox protein HAZ1-like n=1 Tax=Phragmites australis TaxID=29695 RepID=UPI002D7847B8|nr:homeobox protein HAZ1-like [Phragmites australis]